jgi:hypothetical protein
MANPFISGFVPPAAARSGSGSALESASAVFTTLGRFLHDSQARRHNRRDRAELLALAATFESTSPNLAAELRYFERRAA